MVRLSYGSEELPDVWFNKCVEYLRYIAYNQSDRDDAFIHQEYADALEKLDDGSEGARAADAACTRQEDLLDAPRCAEAEACGKAEMNQEKQS